jgi:hypothetical protein
MGVSCVVAVEKLVEFGIRNSEFGKMEFLLWRRYANGVHHLQLRRRKFGF